MATDVRPIVLPCHGASDLGVQAEGVADDLATRGLVELFDDIEQIVAAARDGRDVIALDGCAANCQARLLDARGVPTLALNLTEGREATTASELEAASSPLKRTRRAMLAHTGEPSGRTSHSFDDYLLALDTLTSPVVECGALADVPTLSAHVAAVLGVTRPAAGEMLARLEEAGYVRRGVHKDVLLTPVGRKEADRVLRKQRILECFAVETLGYSLDECYERAREIAPGFDDEALERVWHALGDPDRCPHGWPVDPNHSRTEGRGLLALSAVPHQTAVRVERLDETSRERVKALLESGLAPGSPLEDVVVNTAAEMVAFVTNGERRTVSLTLAGSALVRA